VDLIDERQEADSGAFLRFPWMCKEAGAFSVGLRFFAGKCRLESDY